MSIQNPGLNNTNATSNRATVSQILLLTRKYPCVAAANNKTAITAVTMTRIRCPGPSTPPPRKH